MSRKKILITNDDGVFAEGLVRLVKVSQEFGDVWVVAPDKQKSGKSHSIILRRPIEAWKVDFPIEGVPAYACDGNPADCVRIGVLNIMPDKPDFCFAGINDGYNMATDLQYSGTAGAAFEAAFQGVQAIAFSEGIHGDHEVTNRYIREIMIELMDKPLDTTKIWNVNFPECPLKLCNGVLRGRIVSQDVFYKDHYIETKISEDRSAYMVEGVQKSSATEGTDLRAIIDGYVSIGIATNIV